VCRSWIDYSFNRTLRQILVNQVLGNLVHLHYPGVVTLPGNGRRMLIITWDHYRYAPDENYGTTKGAAAYNL
jgi:hypothetical protein